MRLPPGCRSFMGFPSWTPAGFLPKPEGVFLVYFRLDRIKAFRHPWTQKLGGATGWKDAMTVIDEFHAAPARERREREAEARRVGKYAGSDELDERGRRLDRREFDRTKRVLTLLFNRQLGHYGNGRRYLVDLVAGHPEDYSGDGLPEEPDITLIVSGDGQSWYAWRRTITGWCFGIGAARPPNDKWKYEGAEPPPGAPRVPEWINDMTTSLRAHSNWRRT